MNDKYAALIPCYNVGPACEKVLKGIAPFVSVIVVVDDGSTDDTYSIIQRSAVPGIQLLRHDKNQGKGAALGTGFKYLLQTKPDLDSVITLDGDGQHDANLIPKFIEAREQQHLRRSDERSQWNAASQTLAKFVIEPVDIRNL